MALLIINLGQNHRHRGGLARQRRATAPRSRNPHRPEAGDPSDIEYLAFMRPDFDKVAGTPEAEGDFSRSAGVQEFAVTRSCRRPGSARLSRRAADPMMTEYVVMHGYCGSSRHAGLSGAQANREWRRVRIVRPEERRIGFLGYGLMGKPSDFSASAGAFPISP